MIDARAFRQTVGQFATGGNGVGANLGSQGAIALVPDGHTLFAVNAGSDSISEFAVSNTSTRTIFAGWVVQSFSIRKTSSRCRS